MKKRVGSGAEVGLCGIGEAAKVSKLSIQQIRYLEEIGLLEVTRIKMGKREDRLLAPDDVEFLKNVRKQMDIHRCSISSAASFAEKERK